MVTAATAPSVARPVRDDVREAAWTLGVGFGAGALTGFLVVGPLARLLMLLLRVTSPAAVKGVTSDDGFTIGRVSLDTLFLVLVCSTIAGAAGVAYVFARFAVPHRGLRLALWTAMSAAVGGSAIVRDDGVDFVLLTPTWLAVGGFIALPALAGLLIALLIDRLASIPSPRPGEPRPYVLPAAGLLALPAAPIALVGGALMLALRRLATRPWLVRFVARSMIAIALLLTVLGVVDLVRDVSALT